MRAQENSHYQYLLLDWLWAAIFFGYDLTWIAEFEMTDEENKIASSPVT